MTADRMRSVQGSPNTQGSLLFESWWAWERKKGWYAADWSFVIYWAGERGREKVGTGDGGGNRGW